MAHDKVYGFCEAKCKVEVPNKTEFTSLKSKHDTLQSSYDTKVGQLDAKDTDLANKFNAANSAISAINAEIDAMPAKSISTSDNGFATAKQVFDYISYSKKNRYINGNLKIAGSDTILANEDALVYEVKLFGQIALRYIQFQFNQLKQTISSETRLIIDGLTWKDSGTKVNPKISNYSPISNAFASVSAVGSIPVASYGYSCTVPANTQAVYVTILDIQLGGTLQ
jgi:hypothetical protein